MKVRPFLITACTRRFGEKSPAVVLHCQVRSVLHYPGAAGVRILVDRFCCGQKKNKKVERGKKTS